MVQVEIGDVVGVDVFGQQFDVGGFEFVGGEFQIIDDGLGDFVGIYVFGGDIGEVVYLFVVEGGGVFDGFVDVVLEFVDVIWQVGDVVFVVSLVVGWQVVQYLGQIVLFQFVGQFVFVVGVGEQVFNVFEVVFGSCCEVVYEVDFVVEYCQVGSEFRYVDIFG